MGAPLGFLAVGAAVFGVFAAAAFEGAGIVAGRVGTGICHDGDLESLDCEVCDRKNSVHSLPLQHVQLL